MSTTKPRLRGVSHEIGCYVSGFAGCYLVSLARGPGASNIALIGTTIYSLCLFFMFAASALYHRPTWGPVARARMRKLDHSTIYLLIAGTVTPIALLALHDTSRTVALSLMWAGAGLGVARALVWTQAPKALSAVTYVLLGLAFLPFIPAIVESIGAANTALLLIGALIYVAGAVIYARRAPDPVPAVFGYHEIFHALVIVAAACHYWAIDRIVIAVAQAAG